MLDVSPGHAAALDARRHRAAARTGAGRRRRSPRRGSSRACATAGTRSRRCARPPAAGGSRSATWRSCSRRRPETLTLERGGARDRARAGADPPHLDGRRVLHRGARGGDLRGRRAAAALHGRGARGGLPARRLPAARARLRPGARPDRRRRGEALPPVRARAADPRRRRRAGDRRGDGGAGLRAAAARRADHGPRPPALAAALHRAGRGRPPRDRGRRRTPTSGACGSRSPSPTSPATPG